MILELAVGASLVAAAAYALRALRRHGESLEDVAPEAEAEPPRKKGPRGLRVGDVLLYADTELWLAGCLELQEETLVCRAFRTPGSARANWVLQLDDQGEQLALADPTDEVPRGAVPSELPIGGMRLRLRRKGNATVRAEGDQLPAWAPSASFTIMDGPGGRLLVVVDFEGAERLALKAERIGREMIDLLPGGDPSPEEP